MDKMVRYSISGLSNNIISYFRIVDDGWKSEYCSIDMLLKHLTRRSKSISTRRNFLQQLKNFCEYAAKNPDELIQLKKTENESLVQTYCDRYNSDGYSRRTANQILTILRSFYKVNGFTGIQALIVEGYYTPKRYRKREEYIPEKHEVYRMADASGSLRNRSVILIIYSSGVRSSTLLALRYGDVRNELLQGFCVLRLPIYPEMKQVHPDACKNNLWYYTFICEEATLALRLYLLEKRDRFNDLDNDYPLLSSDYNQLNASERIRKPLTTRQLQKIVKQSAKRAGIEKWKQVTPTSLRKSFESVLRDETVDGKHLDVKEQEFLMGHTLEGAQDNYFDDSKIEHMRFLYSKLSFQRVVIENKFQHLQKVIYQAFKGTGIDPEELILEYVQHKEKMKNVFKK